MINRDNDSVITNYSGQYLGNYRLLHLLGRGGSASVYLGEHVYLKRQAAIKILRTMLGEQEKSHFLNEARLLAGLSHTHIVGVLEFDVLQQHVRSWVGEVEKSIPFLIMDFVPGGSLRTRYPTGSSLPLETVLDYIKQVAVPLQYAHDRGIIHRDIKPENLLLNERQEVMLSDFGLALFAPSPETLSLQGMVGSLPYSAPEQLRGKPHFASDQYSLGIMAYEWLCGRRPFQGEEVEVVMQHVSFPPPSLRSQNMAVSEAVEEVILTALEKDPQRRYPSVQEFAYALEHASKRNVYNFSPYFYPAISLPSSQMSQNGNITKPFSLDSDFEFTESNSMRRLGETEKIPIGSRIGSWKRKQSSRAENLTYYFHGINLTRPTWIVGTLILVLFLSVISFTNVIGIFQTKTVQYNTTSSQHQMTPVGDLPFSNYPIQAHNLTVVKNDAIFINGIAILGPGQQVIVNYLPSKNTYQRASAKPPLTIIIKGLVSRMDATHMGYAPISLRCNNQSIVNSFTMPGAGFNPNTSSFQVPTGSISNGVNQITLTVSSDAKTYFWIYDLKVLQGQV